MSSRLISGFLIVIATVGAVGLPGQADVTGSFGTHLELHPQTTASEVGLLEFDLQNSIDLTVVISGLRSTIHSHFGLAGVEDVTLTTSFTLGAADMTSLIVFGRFDASDTIPDKTDPVFITKRLTTDLAFGGVSLTNLAIVEDTNFPQSPEIAFGDVVTLRGQTESGITIEAQTGICASKGSTSIKKHRWSFSVNPDCYATPKPDLMFDFETLNISGIPLAESITGSASVECLKVQECTLTNTLSFSGGVVPISASFSFTDLFTLEFGGATLRFSGGPGTLTVQLSDVGEIELTSVALSTVLNPESNPATLSVNGSIDPGTGLTSGSIGLTVTRSGITFGTTASFSGGPPASFTDLRFSLATTLGQIEVDSTATFTTAGMTNWETDLAISF